MFYCSIRHIKDATIFPWILTDENGWEFTWMFIMFGVNDLYDEESD